MAIADCIPNQKQANVAAFGAALTNALMAVSEITPGAYVQPWPGRLLSLEFDGVPVAILSRAIISALHWENVVSQRSAEAIIHEAEELLQTARFGLEDLRTRPARAKAGLRAVIVFGRAATFALQNLRSVVDEFEAWYGPHQSALKADPIATYFYDLRTRIEKQAHGVPVSTDLKIKSLTSEDLGRFLPMPPNASALVVGDRNGGSGWMIRTKTGAEEMYYVDFPRSLVEVDLKLFGAPALPGLPEVTASDLAAVYLDTIGKIVQSARGHFLSSF